MLNVFAPESNEQILLLCKYVVANYESVTQSVAIKQVLSLSNLHSQELRKQRVTWFTWTVSETVSASLFDESRFMERR